MYGSAIQGWHHHSNEDPTPKDVFYFLSDITEGHPLYNGLFLHTVISVSDTVNTHLLKVGGLGFCGAEVWPYPGRWPPEAV